MAGEDNVDIDISVREESALGFCAGRLRPSTQCRLTHAPLAMPARHSLSRELRVTSVVGVVAGQVVVGVMGPMFHDEVELPAVTVVYLQRLTPRLRIHLQDAWHWLTDVDAEAEAEVLRVV